MTEETIKLVVYVHAGFGGLALLGGLVALIAKKGSKIHKKAGKFFYYTMLSSALVALIISLLPKHENPFLFAIGIFSSYFVLTGYRSLRFKKEVPSLIVDKIIAWIMIVTGIAMVAYPIILKGSINIILTVFGILGLIFAIQDLIGFKNPEKLKASWLQAHLGKMTGGYISAVTAFVVVNNLIPGIYGWFTPGVIGGVYIVYWSRKVKKR